MEINLKIPSTKVFDKKGDLIRFYKLDSTSTSILKFTCNMTLR